MQSASQLSSSSQRGGAPGECVGRVLRWSDGRGRRGPREVWTPAEDALIRAAAEANRRPGGYTRDDFTVGEAGRMAGRLAEVARELGRSPDAVRKRAQRIGARSQYR